jgi:hypothetical protein
MKGKLQQNMMKKLVFIFTTITLFLGLNSCKEDLNQPNQLNFITYDILINDIIVEKNISSELDVVLISSIKSERERTYTITTEDGTSIDPNTYTLSNTITIPSNSNKGSALLTINSTLLKTDGDILILGVETEEEDITGENKTINITLTCPLVNGAADLVGTWSGTEDSYPGEINTTVTAVLNTEDSSKLDLNILSQDLMIEYMEETIISGGTFTLDIHSDGGITIPRQNIYISDYDGEQSQIEIKGTGIWQNCENKPVLILQYDLYHPGLDIWLKADSLFDFPDNNYPYLKATLTLQ